MNGAGARWVEHVRSNLIRYVRGGPPDIGNEKVDFLILLRM